MAERRVVPSDLLPLVLGFLREHQLECPSLPRATLPLCCLCVPLPPLAAVTGLGSWLSPGPTWDGSCCSAGAGP
uniref:LisH domain-containing protein n=1 Tax=Crocodylus porosus TaxID=8502 RepID=A0A7M4E0S7_CROPO